MKLSDKKKRKRSNQQYVIGKNCVKGYEKKTLSVFPKRSHENWPTPLQAFANEMMKENKNISTVPVQIKVDNKDWTVNVSTTVVSQTKSSSEFPKNREALFKSLKEESYRLLKLVSKKNSIRNDVRMVFDPNENRITPFHINFKDADSTSDKSPDNLDMTKFLSSDVEDSDDDDVSNSDMSVCDVREFSGSPVSLSNVNSGVKILNEVESFIDEESNGQDSFNNHGNEVDTTLHLTLKQCNSNVEEMDSELLCNNKKLPTICGSGTKSEINPENGFKNELNDDILFRGPSQIVSLSRSLDHQHANDFLEKDVDQNTLNEGTDILCLSDVNHLGEEIMVKNELDQQVLPKKIIHQETGSVIHIEVFGNEDDDGHDVIVKSEDGAETGHQFESEYIIPEIDFVDNSGFRCSNERVSDTFHADTSNSSYGFESENSVNLIDDEVSGIQSNNTSHDVVAEECTTKLNEELVLVDNELPSTSLHGTVSDVKGEKDPLSIDGFTGGTLFCDPETDQDNGNLNSSDKNKFCSNQKNIHMSDNNVTDISDNNQESNEENDDLGLSNKWNWSNLKKYNSKTTRNDLKKIRSGHCKEHVNKQSKDDESFIGFSDSTDSSSKYCDFVSACSKLGYYDDMVILNQHYEIIPPNKKGWKFLHSGTSIHDLAKEPLTANGGRSNAILVKKKTSEVKSRITQEETYVKSEIINNHSSDNDPGGVFLGFNSNDNYTDFRRKSIEMTRRLSGEFLDGMNKIDESLNCTIENISNFLLQENEKNPGSESSNGNLVKCKASSKEVKLIGNEQDALLSHDTNLKPCILGIDSKKVGSIEKNRRVSMESGIPKKRGRPRKNQNQCTTNIVKDTIHQNENTGSILEESNVLINYDASIVDQLTNHSVKEPSQPALIVGTESNGFLKSPLNVKSTDTNLADSVQCMNEVTSDISCDEDREIGPQSADSMESVPKKRGRPRKNQNQCTTNIVKDTIHQNENTGSILEESNVLINYDASIVDQLTNHSVKEPSQPALIVGTESNGFLKSPLNVKSTDTNLADSVQCMNEVTSDISCDEDREIGPQSADSMESVPKKRGRPRKNQNQCTTNIVKDTINQNENTGSILEESNVLINDDASIVDQLTNHSVKEPSQPALIVGTESNGFLKPPLNVKSTDTNLADSVQCMNEVTSDISCDEDREIGPQSADSMESVPKKRGRPRKNQNQCTTNIVKDTINQNENTGSILEESNVLINDDASIVDQLTNHSVKEPSHSTLIVGTESNGFLKSPLNVKSTDTNLADSVQCMNEVTSDISCDEDREIGPQSADSMESVPKKRGRPRKNQNQCTTNIVKDTINQNENTGSILEESNVIKNYDASIVDQLTNHSVKEASHPALVVGTESNGFLKSPLNVKSPETNLADSVQCMNEVTSDILCDEDREIGPQTADSMESRIPKKRGRPRKNQNQCTTNIVKDTINQNENTGSILEESNVLINDDASIVDQLTNHSVKEASHPALIVGTESNGFLESSLNVKSPETNLADSVQCMNEVTSDISCDEDREIGPQSADGLLTPDESSFTCTFDNDLNEVESKENILDKSIESISRTKNEPQLVTSTSSDQLSVTIDPLEENTDTELKELNHFQNKDISVDKNELPKCARQESNPILFTNIDHGTENLRYRDNDEDVGHHSVDLVSLTLVENKENTLSTPVGSVSRKRGWNQMNKSQSLTSNATIQCNSSLDMKEKNTEGEASNHFESNDESVDEMPGWTAKEQTPPMSVTSNDSISVLSRSSTSKLTSFAQCMDSIEENSNALCDEIKELDSSIPCTSSFETNGYNLLNESNDSVKKRRGRPRKNPVCLVTSTPTKPSSTLYLNAEDTNADKKESHPFDNEESIVNSTVEHNLTVNSFVSENEKIPTESVPNKGTPTVLKQEDIEQQSEKIIKMEITVDNSTPLKRKPGRPPKRLSLCLQESKQVPNKSNNILDSSLEISLESGNKTLLSNSSVNLEFEPLSYGKQNVMDEKSQDILLIEKKDRLSPLLKRKPGRPPKKRLSVDRGEICQGQLKINALIKNSEKHLISHSSSMDDGSCLLSQIEEDGNLKVGDQCDIGKIKSTIEYTSISNKNKLENMSVSVHEKKIDMNNKTYPDPILKRKPGRPPKHLSVNYHGFKLDQKGNVLVKNSERNLISHSSSMDDGSCLHSQIEEDGNLKVGDQCDIEKIKSTIECTSISNQNKLENMSVSVHEKKIDMNNKTYPDPILKRKPGRPPKHLSVNYHGIKLDQKGNGGIYNSCRSSCDIAEYNATCVSNSPTNAGSFSLPNHAKNYEVKVEPQDSVSINNRDISDLPIKRKPGRPPKHSLLHSKEIEQCQIESKEKHTKDSMNTTLDAMFSDVTKENRHFKLQDKSLMDQKNCLEPPLKRKPGRPRKYLSVQEQKIQQYPINDKNIDLSTNSVDPDALSVEEIVCPEDTDGKMENKEKNSLEVTVERKPDKPLHSLCISQQEIEECHIENINSFVKDNDSSTSDRSINSSIMNSSSCLGSSSKISHPKDMLEAEEKNIVEPLLKRKPGRPPKRLSMGQQEIEKFQLRCTNIENIPVKDSDKSLNSNIMNLSSDVSCSSNNSHLKNDENNKLRDEEKNSFEPPRKRKPGRPPKFLSNGQQLTKKCQIESIKIEDISFSDKRTLDSSPLNSFFSENSLSNGSHLGGADVLNKMIGEKIISFEVPLKRKPGRPPKRLSVGQQDINLFQHKNNVSQNVFSDNSFTGCSEPALKRKPGRPRKVSSELKNAEESGVNNSMLDIGRNGVKIEHDRLFITDEKAIDILSSQDMNETSVESSHCLPKRKPGRPRKIGLVVNNKNDSDMGESSGTSNKLIYERNDISVQSSLVSLESSVNSEYTPKRRPGRPWKNRLEPQAKKLATSTPFANETASSFLFNSFADLELLNDDGATFDEEVPRKRRGKRKISKVMWHSKRKMYSETYYTTFNNDDSNIETSRIVPKQDGIVNIDSSSSHTLNSDDVYDNNVPGTDLSQETECLDDNDLTSKQKARIKKKKLLSGRVDSSTRLKNPNDKVKCALCGEIMTVIYYQKNHLLKHNFMSWLEGEEPLPLDDFDAMETILTRGKRANHKFVFRCEVCLQEKKSSKGLLSHRQFCGKSDKEREGMMVSCQYCGRLMMPVSLPPHLYQSHRTVSDPSPPPEEAQAPGPVRKAAAKCLGKIASIIEENGLTKSEEDFHVDGDEEFDEIEEISLLYIPVQKKKTTKHLMNRWKKLAGENQQLNCIVPTCTFKTFLIKDIVRHHKTCTVDGSQGFSCIKCNYICKVEDEMREHVKSCNPPIIVSQSDYSEDEDQERHVIIPYLKTAEQNLNVRYKALFFKPALTWMNKIYEKYFTQETLYPDLHLNIDLWEEMDPQTSQFYNPEKSNSMMVSFQNSSWESMHALEGKVVEGNEGIAYTGGPVWGLEWCPGEGPQYLAVSSHLSMEFNFQAGSTFTGPGLVQLWSLEDITNAKCDSLSTLQFCYGVCHNDRACWNMAWCPSGGRTDTRIGLLALATTSGSIPIYAMPNPECLQYQSTRFYKPEPVLKLELWSNERWQCSAISWSKIKPHNIIAAGFVNGMVAIWNLGTQSKLLRKKLILYPFKVFQAHHSIITGVCLSPESDNYLATASYDKSFKYWDLHDTTAPHTVLKRGLFTSVAWLRHWMSAVTTYDNAYTMLQTTVSLSSLRGFVNPTTPVITSINSTAWSVSVNDWLNGAIASYDNGQVVLFLALRQSISQHLDKRKFSKIILNSTLHNIEVKDGSPEPHSKQKEQEIHNNNIPSNSYEDATQKYGLSIRTDPDIGRNDIFQEKSSENANDIYPLSSINRVAWNTNRKSFLYTAMGYQSGFLVVSKLLFNSKDFNVISELSK